MMIVPSEPVVLKITPVVLDEPMVLEGQSAAFIPKSQYSQSNFGMMSETFPNEKSEITKIIEFLDKIYCLKDINGSCQ